MKTRTHFGPDRRSVIKKWDTAERRKNPPSPATAVAAAAVTPDVAIAADAEEEAGLFQAERNDLFDYSRRPRLRLPARIIKRLHRPVQRAPGPAPDTNGH